MNSTRRFPLRVAFAAAVALAAPLALAREAQVFYCSTTGSDSNPGTEARPFKTPAYAIAQANTAGDEVRFASGTYAIDSTISIGHDDLKLVGTAARDVIFDADNACRILVTAGNYTGLVLSGITFRKGRYAENPGNDANMKTLGGAVRLVGESSAPDWANTGSVVTNCAFENCSSAHGGGGGLLVAGGSTVVDCSFDNCTGGLDGMTGMLNPGGGALHASTSQADVTVLRCVFTGNVCSNGVGAVSSGSFTGGNYPVFATNAFSLIVRDCGFTNNVSYGYAGCLGTKARTVENCTFKGNESRKSGTKQTSGIPRNCGGVFATDLKDTYLSIPQSVRYAGCRFEDNKSLAGAAGTGGGVFYVSGAVFVEATNCVFTGNSSALYGNVYYGVPSYYAVPSASGGLVMEDCNVFRNSFVDDGTGNTYECRSTIRMNAQTGILRLVRTKFDGNADYGSGGVVHTAAPGTEIVDCEFRANVASCCGFAPATVNFFSSATNSVLRGCLFAANTNEAPGGCTIRFGTFQNSAGTTGGLNCTVESSTFAGNRWTGTSYSNQSGAVNFRESVEGAVVRNCVFWDNHSTESDTVRNFSTVQNCKDIAQYCWEDGSQLTTGTRNNIAGGTTPRFADAANGDWTPTASSPWVNLGRDQPWMAGARDLRNDRHFPRLNGVVDMGCYEYSPLVSPTVLSFR